ncbi:tripartite-type tricarboxylate transporter receptor subunit TctC [Humitalea rosea]|uniref:Tripartite-type tricarboxylate transporter receptor subunit TctC n=1 Tax=Humitalea rosea TaxID=990373 RepID=A0A2W7J8W7_9PROT|nr:tripartite tricarboxylate transporter substrate binding protein [Humitalea rosea]PZW48306.1 tripartite-type tricarboxylate transporter receptor subunit TctC [Humitalea rosea]
MHTLSRRTLAGLLLGAAAAPSAARAQANFPTRSLRMIAPYAPGGGVDTSARLLAMPMGAAMGQTVIVENRPGAGGSIGAAEVARAAPDGYTVLLDALGHVLNPVLQKNLPFDYSTAFTPITQLLIWPQIFLCSPRLPVRTLPEFIAYAKSKPGELSYGSSGNATAAHLAASLLFSRAEVTLEHVPYRGGTPALQDLLAGNVACLFGTVASSLQFAKEGTLRPLAVTTTSRLAALPNVPTVAEQGFPGFELNEWNGLYAPAGLPVALRDRWYNLAKAALADSNVAARLEGLGAIPVGSEPAAFAAFVVEQRTKMQALVTQTGIEIG